MSDGRRLADDGNNSIRNMKTSSDRTLMEIFIFNTMRATVGWDQTKQPNIRNKNLNIGMLSMPMVVSDWSTRNHSYIT